MKKYEPEAMVATSRVRFQIRPPSNRRRGQLEQNKKHLRGDGEMGLFKKFVSQTRKPEGFLGKVMLSGMNSGHAAMADWGFSHLPPITPEKAVDLGCGGGIRSPIDVNDVLCLGGKVYRKQMLGVHKPTNVDFTGFPRFRPHPPGVRQMGVHRVFMPF